MTIHDAVKAGKLAQVRKLLTQSENANSICKETGETALEIATETGNIRIISLLLDAGADPNLSHGGDLPLAVAARSGDLSLLSLLLSRGANANGEGEDGDTALIAAAAAGHLKVVKALIGAGANPKHQSSHGHSPVIAAAENGHLKVVEYLRPLCAPKDRQRLAAMTAVRSQPADPKQVEQLVKAAWEGDLGQLKLLIEQGVPVDVRSAEGQTPLMLAANNDHVELVAYLLEQGSDPQLTDVYHECGLTFALMGNARRSFELLLPRSKPTQVVRARKWLEHKRRYIAAYKGWRLPRVPSRARKKK